MTNQASTTTSMDTHLTIVAALHIALSILGMAGALLVAAILTTTGLAVPDLEARRILVPLGTIIATVVLALSIPGVIGGVGLFQRQPWSRLLLLIVGGLNLVNVPFGTLLGAYTIWVLVQPDAVRQLTPADQHPTTTTVGHASR